MCRTMNKIIKINKLSHCVVESVEKTPIFDMKKEKLLLQDKTSKRNYLNCLMPFINACILIYKLVILI